MAIFDRPQSYRAAQASEAARGAEIDIGLRQDEVAYRVASLFFDADQAARSLTAVGLQLASLNRVRDLVAVRVNEGRELPIESSKADLKVLQAQQRQADLTDSIADTETSLAQVLGFDPGDRVQPAQEDRRARVKIDSEEAAIQQALESNREIRRLESNLQAKNLEIKGYKAERLPKVDLVAQYSLLSKYNNYEKFFGAFQRNNVELGMSFDDSDSGRTQRLGLRHAGASRHRQDPHPNRPDPQPHHRRPAACLSRGPARGIGAKARAGRPRPDARSAFARPHAL